MPGLITHHYFAQYLKTDLPSVATEIVSKAQDAYGTGAQGPDILFGLIFDKRPTRHFGKQVHNRKIYEVFFAAARRLAHTEDPVLFSYVIGMLTHYCLDRVVHPYVFDRVERDMSVIFQNIQEAGARHMLLETMLNTYIIEVIDQQSRYGRILRGGNLIPASRGLKRLLEDFYGELAPIFDLEIKRGDIKRALFCFRTEQYFSNTLTGALHSSKAVLNRLFAKETPLFLQQRQAEMLDIVNERRQPWPRRRYGEEKTTECFCEMLERAKEEACQAIDDFCGAVRDNRPPEKRHYILNYSGEKFV